MTLYSDGRYKEAEELEVQVMETRRRVLGEEYPSTLTSMANLALTYMNQGRWKEAEELEMQVMETSSRVLGEEHPSTLVSMANLASTFSNQGRWKEAEELEMQVMETSSRVLGEDADSVIPVNDSGCRACGGIFSLICLKASLRIDFVIAFKISLWWFSLIMAI
ncbi:Kinesin light chain 5 [Paraphaeosphaeria sporulosa]